MNYGPNQVRVVRRLHLQRGLTMVELMIAMLLGIILIGTIIGVLLAGRQNYRTNEALAQLQESARTSFELLAREIRQAGVSGCGNGNRVANTLNPVAANWWAVWGEMRGYDGVTAAPTVPFGAAIGDRVAGTDAIFVQGIGGDAMAVADHEPANSRITLNAVGSDLIAGDILVICDIDHATVFQASAVDVPGVVITHDLVGVAPGNCSRGLGFPTNCDAGAGNAYRFGSNSQISRMSASIWYVGNNGRLAEGGQSLFRARLGRGGVVAIEEIVAGVSDLQLNYREAGNDVLTPNPVNWAEVNAVELTFTLESLSQNVSSDFAANDGRLQRNYTTLIGLRNRLE